MLQCVAVCCSVLQRLNDTPAVKERQVCAIDKVLLDAGHSIVQHKRAVPQRRVHTLPPKPRRGTRLWGVCGEVEAVADDYRHLP